jgi:hypothetical protein
MKNRNYFVLALLLAVPSGVVVSIHNSPQPLANTTNENRFSIGDANIELKQKIITQKTATTTAIAANENSEKTSDSSKPKNEIKKETDVIAENIEITEVEPTNTNADMLAAGEFSDQINLALENSDCQESCADNADVDIPAVGEFAEQINADVIFNQALLKNPELKEEIKLTEISANSDPSIELGAYTPPASQ